VRESAIGRLAFKDEPGKVRVFAMVDIVTQWIMKPLHDYLFSLLKTIRQDATFDQEKGIAYLQSMLRVRPVSFSFDLSAATDRLPIKLQILILNQLWPHLGDHWANLLVSRDYLVPNSKGFKDVSVRYACGQPMGALSSWAMLAFTHHFLVQFAAFRAGYVGWFQYYLVLGDDLVILDSRVAKQYLRVMRELDVGVNPSKSLVSNRGIAEFAKRVVSCDAMFSGVSLKEFTKISSNFGMILETITKFSVSLPSFLRFMGLGSFSAGHHSPSIFIRTHKAMLYRLYEIKVFGVALFEYFTPWVRYLLAGEFLSRAKWLTPRAAWVFYDNVNTPMAWPKMSSLVEADSFESTYRTLMTLFKGVTGKKEWAIAQSFLLALHSVTVNWKAYSDNTDSPFLSRLNVETKAFCAVFSSTPLWSELMWGRSIMGKEKAKESLDVYSKDINQFNLDHALELYGEDLSSMFSVKSVWRDSSEIKELFEPRPGVSPDEVRKIRSFKDLSLHLSLFWDVIKAINFSLRNIHFLPVWKEVKKVPPKAFNWDAMGRGFGGKDPFSQTARR
jgi:hypothetical protein